MKSWYSTIISKTKKMIAQSFMIFYLIASIHASYGYRQLVIPGETTANQSSTYYNYRASRAVDGYPSFLSMNNRSCSHTGVGQTVAWLLVNLQNVYNIRYIKFWYRNDRMNDLINTERLHGYFLQYYTNTKWGVCYQDTTPVYQAIPMPSTVECPQQAQYIRFYTNTSSVRDNWWVILEICEIEVYGCDQNQYGDNCTECGEHCEKCHITNGCVQCQPRFTGNYCEDCELGYSGLNCEPCERGWYGFNCSRSCSGNCLNSEDCDKVNGSCLKGCGSGYRGYTCSQPCENGTYGFDCLNQCRGHCFKNEPCENVEGICTNGCKMGWEGRKCTNVCRNGTFGKDCKANCSGHCYSNMPCDKFTGVCPDGCDVGWFGSMCNKLSEDLTKSNTYTTIIVGVTGTLGILGGFILIVIFVSLRKCRKKQESVYDSIRVHGLQEQENPYSGLNPI